MKELSSAKRQHHNENAVISCKLFIFVAACLEPLGVENFHIPDSSFSSSPNYLRRPKRARLGYYKNEMWAARNKNLDQFLQVTTEIFRDINAVTDGSCGDIVLKARS